MKKLLTILGLLVAGFLLCLNLHGVKANAAEVGGTEVDNILESFDLNSYSIQEKEINLDDGKKAVLLV
ncbi:hypothetical protein [Listeria sp. PSOL-1]|uniref:hypothetical protein n=1 Tax=Listeria sp. PSOL-1 TaxID=1844999 RepID=UPI0013D5B00B|nr:hypothetical protein [Listeria sp. PSOL-1]